MSGLDEWLGETGRFVNEILDELIPGSDVGPSRLHEAIRWSVFAGGKRIRPAIMFASGEAFGVGRSDLARTAAAIEMIHTFSLIHDDLPSMDDDDLRRGRATCHRKFGEATAILAGDALQVLAFKTIADDDRLSFELRTKLVSLVATASGTPHGMVAGQQLDLDAEGKESNIEDIDRIHTAKTGALISAAAVAGALIGDADEAEVQQIRYYSERLGLLFQITDDLLDVTQESKALGKTAGKDVAAQKATYPGILGIPDAFAMADQVHLEACSALECLDRPVERLRQLADLIRNRTQ